MIFSYGNKRFQIETLLALESQTARDSNVVIRRNFFKTPYYLCNQISKPVQKLLPSAYRDEAIELLLPLMGSS